MKHVTQEELEKIFIAELDKLEGCRGVKSISFYFHPHPEDPTWTYQFVNFGDADKTSCLAAMPNIIEKLRTEFELIPNS